MTTFTPALTNEMFATADPLQTRIETHRRYTVPNMDLPTWVLDAVSWHGAETVLEVGTGTGQFLPAIRRRAPDGRLLALDLSFGMLSDLLHKYDPAGAVLLNADAQALPLADQHIDTLLASYVLFFIPDIPCALQEARRVLRPGGRLLAVTMSEDYLGEYHTMLDEAARTLGAGINTRTAPAHRFSAENSQAQLEAVFDQVEATYHDSALIFPEVPPVLAFANSMRAAIEPKLPPGTLWSAYLAEVERRVAAEIQHHGFFRTSKRIALFIATRT